MPRPVVPPPPTSGRFPLLSKCSQCGRGGWWWGLLSSRLELGWGSRHGQVKCAVGGWNSVHITMQTRRLTKEGPSVPVSDYKSGVTQSTGDNRPPHPMKKTLGSMCWRPHQPLTHHLRDGEERKRQSGSCLCLKLQLFATTILLAIYIAIWLCICINEQKLFEITFHCSLGETEHWTKIDAAMSAIGSSWWTESELWTLSALQWRHQILKPMRRIGFSSLLS